MVAAAALRAAARRPILVRLLVGYFEGGTPNYAAGLAFNAFLTMFPIVLGLFAILGLVLHDRSTFREVEHVVVQAFPVETRGAVLGTLQDARTHAGTLGLISVAGLLWSGTALFASLEFALNQIYRVGGRNPIRQRLAGLRLIVVFAIAIVLAVALNAAIGFLNGQLLNAAAYLNVVAGWLIITYLLFWIYRYVPNRPMASREVLPGAVAAGGLIELSSLGFPLLYELTHRAGAYARSFALLVVLATWLYLMSQLLLMGALFNRLIAEGASSGGVPPLEETAPIATLEDAEAAGVQVGKAGGQLDRPAEKGDRHGS